MKKLIMSLLLLGVMPISMMAQDDDMYFVPTKENVAKEAKTYGMPTNTYYAGSSRSVDDYNRRAWSTVEPVDSLGNDIIDFSAVRGVYPDSAYSEMADNGDYQLTRQMSRFDDYTPSDAYWEGYRDGRWMSPWYSSRYYNSWYSWYDPWYWNDPWYYPGWHYGWYDPWYYGYYSPWRPGYYGYYGYGGWGGSYHGSYHPRKTTHRVQHLGGSNYGGHRGTSSRPGTRDYRSSGSSFGGSRSSGSFGGSSGVRSSGSFGGGSRSGGGSFGGGRSTSGGRNFGGRR